MQNDIRHLPQRWAELDPRTIEFIARLNEQERNHLIALGNLPDKEVARLKRFLSLEDDKWEAGFRIVTRAVVAGKIAQALPRTVFFLAAIFVALDQIWTRVLPWLGVRP